MIYKRFLDLPELLTQRSHFLFGPRQTGKSTLLALQLEHAKVYDLLNPTVFQRLLVAPETLAQEIDPHQVVVIDEIQKLPEILDMVHHLVESRGVTFLLTGSSARKLKRGAANLLAGRAWPAEFFPLTYCELQEHFDLDRFLLRGGLPRAYQSELYEKELNAYVSLYLKEEIQSEAAVRNLTAFSKFIEVVAFSSGKEVVYSKVASDCGVPARTVQNHFEILIDTLVGFFVKPYSERAGSRKSAGKKKFYFFDVGLVNSMLARKSLKPGTVEFGESFKHFIAQELRAFLSYCSKTASLMYWRTRSFEVDFVIGEEIALEVKSTDLVQPKHLVGLRAFRKEGTAHRLCVISRDAHFRKTDDGIEIYPWKLFLDRLWSGELME